MLQDSEIPPMTTCPLVTAATALRGCGHARARAFQEGGPLGSTVSDGSLSAAHRKPLGQGLPSPLRPSPRWPRACARWLPAELPRHRALWRARPSALPGPRPTSSLLLPAPGVSPQLRARSVKPASFLGVALGGAARRGHGSPVPAGPPAALAQGELQRSLYCLDPHQGAEGVCGVCAQVGGGGPAGGWPGGASSGDTWAPHFRPFQPQDVALCSSWLLAPRSGFPSPMNLPSALRGPAVRCLVPFLLDLGQVSPALPSWLLAHLSPQPTRARGLLEETPAPSRP